MKSFPPSDSILTLIARRYSFFDIDMKSVLQNADIIQVYIALAHALELAFTYILIILHLH